MRLALAAIASILWSIAADAHDLWLTTSPDRPVRVLINYGHPDDRPPPAAEKVIDLRALTADRSLSLLPDLVRATSLGAPVLASQPIDFASALLVAEYDNGYFVKTANGYRNTSKRLFPEATDSVWSVKFAKTVLGPAAPWDHKMGQDLELVPQANPSAIAPGSRLRVRVIFRGQPLANAQIELTDGLTPIAQKNIPVFTTDRDGDADIPIDRSGPQLLAIDHRVKPSATPELADGDLYNATLFFTVETRQ
ncbi:MAG: DUF4198 domain-containing protein [Alphaproteobacteria bacterium]|nr:DUF4198 domain-containing protein [Alphaproteobacteria bacterium]